MHSVNQRPNLRHLCEPLGELNAWQRSLSCLEKMACSLCFPDMRKLHKSKFYTLVFIYNSYDNKALLINV